MILNGKCNFYAIGQAIRSMPALLSVQSRQISLRTLPYGTNAQSLHLSVDLIIGRTLLKVSVIYDHHC